jgi:adenosylcobinamide-GDP ribazoletransferase
MRSFLAAVAFLTRIPVGRFASVDWADVARAGGWFPFVGALLGATGVLFAFLVHEHLPAAVVAVLMVLLEVLLTGALHFDALADMADGFGGGNTREDVLRIMRDHAIGSYGGTALVLLIALKVTVYAALLQHNSWIYAAIAAPTLGRWSILLLTNMQPQARPAPSPVDRMGKQALLWGTLTVVAGLLATRSLEATIAAVLVPLATLCFGRYCRHRIGGITGDTTGANVELSQSAVLLVFLWMAQPR